ncbi:MAG: hypothetical protein DRH37_08680 [Deltaproteobacteria bacterium]|nr:MAG: hypothetical protein DRH37_08680 [Deltaproteobacteria bacterium]
MPSILCPVRSKIPDDEPGLSRPDGRQATPQAGAGSEQMRQLFEGLETCTAIRMSAEFIRVVKPVRNSDIRPSKQGGLSD